MSKPNAVIAMPIEAMTLGSILSDKRPTNGEKTAIVKGCIIIITPAIVADIPFKYCKYKLIKTIFANIAA